MVESRQEDRLTVALPHSTVGTPEQVAVDQERLERQMTQHRVQLCPVTNAYDQRTVKKGGGEKEVDGAHLLNQVVLQINLDAPPPSNPSVPEIPRNLLKPRQAPYPTLSRADNLNPPVDKERPNEAGVREEAVGDGRLAHV